MNPVACTWLDQKRTGTLRQLATLICWKQTFFSLPWLLSSVLVSSIIGDAKLITPWQWALVTLAFVATRVAAMSLNQWLDAEIDRQNPRTANRPLPAGDISFAQVRGVAVSALLIFLLASFGLSTKCLIISLCIAPLLVGYSLCKRFTWTSHLVLGVIQALLPISVGIALNDMITQEHLLLGIGLGGVISGMDVLYALQDIDVDRQQGLFSIPSFFGVEAALWWSRALHVVALGSLAILGDVLQLSYVYFAGWLSLLILFVVGHIWVARHRDRVERIFAIGCVIPGFVIFIALTGSAL